jgi:hypothetical protein
MKIGRLIERNVFTCIWLLGIILYFLAGCLFIGCDAEPGITFSTPIMLFMCIYRYVFNFITWPQDIISPFFDAKDGLCLINVEWITYLSLIISLGSFIAIDFLLRKFLWNKKRVPEKNIV